MIEWNSLVEAFRHSLHFPSLVHIFVTSPESMHTFTPSDTLKSRLAVSSHTSSHVRHLCYHQFSGISYRLSICLIHHIFDQSFLAPQLVYLVEAESG